jgi:MHS family citrate/tricarballylate:H+ symporter-like MFS transporter
MSYLRRDSMREERPSPRWPNVLRATCGNFLEMFDFFLFGLYAPYIARTFFPAHSLTASLLQTFAVFGAGFLMRPLGAVILGAYVDSKGRTKGLTVTLGIMAMGTLLIALVPGYDRLGLLAPLLVLIGRLLQGFSAGVELGGVSVYLAEMAPPGRRGFFVAWQSASQQLAIIFAAGLGFALDRLMPADGIAHGGWRLPFLVGCLLVPFLFYIRRSLDETPDFLARRHPALDEILRTLVGHWPLVLAGMMLVSMTTVFFYLITVYTPTYGETVLKLSATNSLIVTCCVGASNFFWLPLMGALSDRVGRKPLLVCFAALALLLAYPLERWLVGSPSFARMLTVELLLSFLYAGYNGALVVTLTEIMPGNLRTTGFSLAYSFATAVFGGFTPAVSTWLIAVTGDKASPGLWLTAAAATATGAIVLLRSRIASAWLTAQSQ